ncbi:Cation transporter family protein [Teladorsagia circumcincta]|uniref:Gamma-aminobutyric acid receptor subunit beta n=2 Tax=Teladorsagia circumcincta TaxID=45464 RepID=A0A2G9V3H7_TELCI|nr:Cation transporter family protein [Teladorsagia circumcincta]
MAPLTRAYLISAVSIGYGLACSYHNYRRKPNTEDFSDKSRPNESLESNVSKLLDKLIASHDRRIRPNYGGPPIEVNITAHITTISAITEVSMDYTLDLYLRQIWKDPRLAWESDVQSSLTIGIDMVKTIWTPDTFFPNEKKSFFHEATSHNSFLRIDNHGNVLRSIRLTVTANCPMNLHTECALEIESYGYSTRDIIYHWHDANAVTIDENVHLAHFSIGDHYHIERTISLSTGNYSRLSAYFTFKRNLGFYLIQIYFPSSLIVVISWVSFWLNREAVQARVAIGVTTVLTMTTLMTSTNASLPKVSYVKSLDIFLGMCFFIVFASLLEYAAIGYLMKRNRSLLNASPVQYYETGDGVLRRESSRKKTKNNRKGSVKIEVEAQLDQRIPLLTMVPMPPIPFKPKPPAWTKVRPSQVDLFSRVAFPSFFLLFHVAYWGFYLNVSSS